VNRLLQRVEVGQVADNKILSARRRQAIEPARRPARRDKRRYRRPADASSRAGDEDESLSVELHQRDLADREIELQLCAVEMLPTDPQGRKPIYGFASNWRNT